MDRVLQAMLMTDYAAYCTYVMRDVGWCPSRFHKYLCDTVQSFVETDTGHAFDILVLSTPPQHGKSVTITETLPSWYLGRHPDRKVIEISYSEDFAKRFGKRNLEKIREFGDDIFGIKIGYPASSLDFEIEKTKGKMISRGISSGVTGQTAHLMIIDDPIKNRQEADSEAYRSNLIDEWLNSFKTRLMGGAKVIIIQTRWHENDLAGYVLENEDNVIHVNIPLEAEDNDPLGRPIGSALLNDVPSMGKDDR